MKKVSIIIVSILLLLCCLNVLASASTEKPHVVLKMAMKSSGTTPIGQSIQQWIAWNNEANTGLELQFFPDSQLGTEQEMIEQVLMGENLCMLSDATMAAYYSPQLAILMGPYFVSKLDDFLLVNETEWFKEQIAKLEESNIKCVNSRFLFGQRHTVAKKPVRSPEDLKGVKMRSQPGEVSIAVVEAMGATATPLPFAEIYTALAQGVIDAAENPLSTIYNTKHHEAAKFISLTGHMSTLSMFLMNNTFFNESLTEEQREVFIETGNRAANLFNNEINPKAEKDSKLLLEKEGVTFIEDVDIEAFVEATKGVYDLIDEWGAYDTVKDQMEAFQ